MKFTRTTYLILIAIIFHLVGIVGFFIDPKIVELTPFNLLLVFTLLMLNNPKGYSIFWISSLVIIGGILIESIGVNTGLLFGDYHYGNVLGPKIMGVPITIGLNWFVLTYSSYQLSTKLVSNSLIRGITTGIICTLFDIILEPVAIHYNFWVWDTASIPIFNYVTWFIFSFLFSFLYWKNKSESKLPISILIIWFVFFSILNLFQP